ncbi:hypothetical protein [Sediminivirga luteola]|uniref:Uncharacterized protein n=1 Tax=Sediminivirga luteola TaxID=1774748 RepID=A0A8J2TXZ4_9MICO|nr:hypothetical protein [Sediminivirga luteola]GGA14217.1 hypothetical protein GCM10011333_16430 [Sediminivirga luteola]
MRLPPKPAAVLASAAAAALLAGVAACQQDTALRVEFAQEPRGVMTADDPVRAALAASYAGFDLAEAALLLPAGASGEQTVEFARVAEEARLPLLIDGAPDGDAAEDSHPDDAGSTAPGTAAEELERLGTTTLIVPEGTEDGAWPGGFEIVGVDPADLALPVLDIGPGSAPVHLLLDPLGAPAADQPDGSASGTEGENGEAVAVTVARANVLAAGGQDAELPGGDPRRDGGTVATAKELEDRSVVAIGPSFGAPEQLQNRLTTAATVPELPGGGQLAFPSRRMVAAYGSPGVPSLGVLGEQDVDEAIALVQDYARDYQQYSDEPVVPAFEIIATVASAVAGPDGNYSTEIDPETLRPWVDAAGEAGVYVVLDLQPGTTDFRTQAMLYEDLLREPHVGLALDPEWRLEDGQRHMEQIGSVSAEEINQTADWLANLVREHELPQKVFILHQFTLSMITERQDVDASHEELAVTLHADGNGSPGAKMETWNRLQEDLPDGIWMAWKNFIDEDDPTFTPEQTYEVEPRPWFVSYQ